MLIHQQREINNFVHGCFIYNQSKKYLFLVDKIPLTFDYLAMPDTHNQSHTIFVKL